MSQQTSSTVSVANSAGGAAQQNTGMSGILGSMMPLLLMLFAFYFLLMRPQQKRDAKRREMINAVSRGDKVVLTSGIIGTVHKIIGDNQISLEVSENVRIRVLKNAISEVLGKGALFDEHSNGGNSGNNKGSQKKKQKQEKNNSVADADEEKDLKIQSDGDETENKHIVESRAS